MFYSGKHRVKKMNRITKAASRYNIELSHEAKNLMSYYQVTDQYSVKQIGKWVTTCKPNEDETPIILITTLINICSTIHLYTKVKRGYTWMFILRPSILLSQIKILPLVKKFSIENFTILSEKRSFTMCLKL